ncbi:MAG: hypothetical protein ACTH1Z_04075 [Ancrocorticia sp.]|uniref:hypothetical protein n=1 Tax=Ancrocorticia sp. TaxID=2593684 RepID=UPI003F901797
MAVVVAILIMLVVLAVVLSYLCFFYLRSKNVSSWVSDSVAAWRADELEVHDEFDVQVVDGRLGDLADFPLDAGHSYGPDEIGQVWNEVRTFERGAAEAVTAPVISAAGKLRRSAASAVSADRAER